MRRGERGVYGRRISRKFAGRGSPEAEAWTPGRIWKCGDRRNLTGKTEGLANYGAIPGEEREIPRATSFL